MKRGKGRVMSAGIGGREPKKAERPEEIPLNQAYKARKKTEDDWKKRGRQEKGEHGRWKKYELAWREWAVK